MLTAAAILRTASIPTLLVGALLAAACSPSHVTTNSDRSAIHQLLSSEATERALSDLRWPEFGRKKVFIRAVSPGGAADERYLRASIEAEVEARDGRVVADLAASDWIVTIRAGALGTTESGSFVGLPETTSALLPVGTPEVSLYKSVYQRGFAKTELFVTDRSRDLVIHHDGPTQAITFWHEYDVTVLGFRKTNTTWDETAETRPVAPAPVTLGAPARDASSDRNDCASKGTPYGCR